MKTIVLPMKVTANERKLYSEAARSLDLTLEQWLRYCAMKELGVDEATLRFGPPPWEVDDVIPTRSPWREPDGAEKGEKKWD